MNVHPETPPKLHPTVLDTSVVQIARVYALALHNAASKTNQLEAIVEEYESFIGDVLAKDTELERFLRSSIIGRNDKATTLTRAFEGRASQIFMNYLKVLNDHDRLDLLRPALSELKSIRDEQLGRVPVRVQAAVPLEPVEQKALQDRLAAVVAGQPVIHAETDPALLGGLVIRIGDTVYDGSVRTRLRRMREQLIQRSTHEIQSRRDQFSTPT